MLRYKINTYPMSMDVSVLEVKVAAERDGKIGIFVPGNKPNMKDVHWIEVSSPFFSFHPSWDNAVAALIADAQERLDQAQREAQHYRIKLAALHKLTKPESIE